MQNLVDLGASEHKNHSCSNERQQLINQKLDDYINLNSSVVDSEEVEHLVD